MIIEYVPHLGLWRFFVGGKLHLRNRMTLLRPIENRFVLCPECFE